MAHQLYVLQVLTFNLLEERMMTKMDPNDQAGAGGHPGISCAVSSWLWSFRLQCVLRMLCEVVSSKLVWATSPEDLGQRPLLSFHPPAGPSLETGLGARALLSLFPASLGS
jgi:hypothetical protein